MIQFLGYPKFIAWDDLGNPASGYKVWTYAAGTTTPTATYPTIADALASTNPNANPVVLDSRGEGLIVPKVSTKFVLTTAIATDISSPIWTVDNVYTPVDIYDTNGNLILKFSAASNAVNYLQIKNSATGVDLEIDALGTDTNINIKIVPKGTGIVSTPSKLSAAGIVISDNSGIYDSNNLLVLDVNPVASAVNYLQIRNNSTGGSPVISSQGTDTNINMTFATKGSGVYVFSGTTSTPAKLFLQEDSDNGGSSIVLSAPAALASDMIFQFPSTMGSSGNFLTTDGTGVTSWGGGAFATQAEMEAASSTTTIVAPGTAKYHPGMAKFWVTFSGSGVFVVFHSHNVTSITDLGTGLYRVTFTTAFSHSLCALGGMCSPDGVAHIMTTNFAVDVLTTSVTVAIVTGSVVASDASYVSVIGYGDQ